MTEAMSRRHAALESFRRTAIQTGIGQAVVLAVAGFVLSRGTGGMSGSDWWLALGAVAASALAAAVMRWLSPLKTDTAGTYVTRGGAGGKHEGRHGGRPVVKRGPVLEGDSGEAEPPV